MGVYDPKDNKMSKTGQIIKLVVAIVFVGAKDGVYQGETGLLLSVSVLLLLVLFLIKGPGNNSLDHSLRFKKEN